jgi:hypothetical protein
MLWLHSAVWFPGTELHSPLKVFCWVASKYRGLTGLLVSVRLFVRLMLLGATVGRKRKIVLVPCGMFHNFAAPVSWRQILLSASALNNPVPLKQ